MLQRRKEWDADKETGQVRTRFSALRSTLVGELVALDTSDSKVAPDPEVGELYARIVKTLGFERLGLTRTTDGPVTRVAAAGLARGSWTALVLARPVDALETLLDREDANLLEPYQADDATTLTSVSRCLSTLFVDDDHPDFALVLAGRFLLIAERERWPEGRYLAVDLQLVAERNDDKRDGEVDRALTCLSAESLAPDAEGTIWWRGVLEESIRHTVGVSQDLRDGVRASIEIIANDVVARRSAAGLQPLPADQAQDLARQALRFLYRILFLLFAESSPELGVLPVGVPEYERGYSLDRLRDLTLVELASPKARNGRHLYDSLAVLFRLVDQGHGSTEDESSSEHQGLTFQSLRADLFRPEAVELIHEVRLSNEAMQRVLRHLLLSKEKRGKDRGFISYAELGINQLGAVYEGLMSYTGFFAETDLYEVAKNGDGSKGSWVVPIDGAEGIAAADFIYAEDEITGEPKPVLHERGSFVFRLAGRERQQSASYYTPEVLTRFVVSQALEELLDQDGNTTKAEEILCLTVCEPALGSGAFAIEATRQLAEQYLTRRQSEVGKRIPPEEYPRELQRVKASIALHQVYGVDRNDTAVELAEISLWLDTMVEGLAAPWFGLHLRRGNSLVGARRAVYSRDQVSKRTWLTAVPRDVPLAEMAEDLAADRVGGVAGSVPHFLLPAEGWGSAVDAKEAKALAPERMAELKTWRKIVLAKPTRAQVDDLVELGYRVERLWQIAYQRLSIAEQEVRRAIPLWQREPEPAGTVSREEIEAKLADADGGYRRLRRVMDAWNALWFWPLTDSVTTVDGQSVRPPSLDQWISAIQQLLGRQPEARRRPTDHQTLASGVTWEELGQLEHDDLAFAGATSVALALDTHPWLVVCERIAQQQGFFHWGLDFAPVFARGGFDLQLGNPPWVRPRSDVEALLAEGDPWWQLEVKPTQVRVAAKRVETLAMPGLHHLVLDGTSDIACLAAFIGSPQQYPYLTALQPDLYRCFMEQTWRHQSEAGAVGLIHPETHFTDEKAGALRQATYARLRRHWQFVNALFLFEVHDQVSYGIHIYGATHVVAFKMATSLYHPETVERSLVHDGSGPEPGLRDPDGHWDLRPHSNRIIDVTEDTLQTWHAVLEDDAVPVRHTRMVYAVNRATAAVLDKLSHSPRLGELGLEFSRGWDESIDRKKGYFETSWGVPNTWEDVILQGPHLFVSTPIYKTPNKTLLHNQDWSATDFEQLPADAIPATAYRPATNRVRYDAAYTHWGNDGRLPARDYYRVAWRNMAANRNERTLISAVIPPGAAQINGVTALGAPSASAELLVAVAGSMSSLISDFFIRVAPKSTITARTSRRLPRFSGGALSSALALRVLRLNCLTAAYEDLWQECYHSSFANERWTADLNEIAVKPLGDVGPDWNENTPLRVAVERRQAQLEIDVIVSLDLGLTSDELCTIYRTQFSVLFGYDRKAYYYDSTGRLVPNAVLTLWRTKGDRMNREDRTATNQAGYAYTYEPPFATLDREADMRQAYAQFERRLKEQGDE